MQQGWKIYCYDDVYEMFIVVGCKNFQIRDTNLNSSLVCKPYLQFLYGTYINSDSELFIHKST